MCCFFICKRKHAVLLLGLLVVAIFVSCIIGVSAIQTKNECGVRVPVLMYHSILKSPSAAGDYVVSPQTLEEDLTYLKAQGYTSVRSSDLVAYVREGKPLPAKPIVITFDDGHANNLLYALPILEKLDMCAVVCIVGIYSEQYSASDDHNPSYAYLSWEEIDALVASGRIEIANHSYNMHAQTPRKGTMRMRGEAVDVYTRVLRTDLLKTQALLKENCNVEPIAFSYPFGAVCDDAKSAVRELGFSVTYGCAEQVNYVKNADSLYCMGRFNRPSGISTQKFMERIEKE